jgi:hypothetical protein
MNSEREKRQLWLGFQSEFSIRNTRENVKSEKEGRGQARTGAHPRAHTNSLAQLCPRKKNPSDFHTFESKGANVVDGQRAHGLHIATVFVTP